MKLLLRMLGWVAGIIVVLSVVLVVVNLVDEDPDPAAQAALDRSFTVKDAENGFYVVAGLYAPAGQDAHDYGKALVSRWSREDAKPRLERDYGRDLNGSTIAGLIRKYPPREWCDWNKQQCLDAFVQHRQQIEQAAGTGAELLLRYLSIQRYPSYQDYISGTVETPMPPYLGIIWAAGVRNAQCALLVRDGNSNACLEMLQQDVGIARKMLSGGRTVLGKMVPLTLLNHDYRLLSEILAADNTAASRQSAQLDVMLKPLSAAEMDFSKALLEGFMSAPSLLQEVRDTPATSISVSDGTSHTPPFQFIADALSRVFLKVNATINRDYRVRKLLQEQSRLPAREFIDSLDEYEGKVRAIVPRKISIGMVYNPIGKILLAIALPDTRDYIFRLHNLDGLQRLVRMQWQVLQQEVTPEQIPAFLEAAGPQYANPYTEQPLDWNAGTRTLSFSPMGKHTQAPGGRYKVKI